MKKLCCLLLALVCLPLLPARADLDAYESSLGFTLWFDETLFTVTEAEDGAEMLLPRDPRAQAVLRCAVLEPAPEGRPGEDPMWTPEEDDFELTIKHACFSAEGEDRAEKVLCVFTVDGCYTFSVQYPPDEDDWAESLWDVVHTVEFPPQPAAAGSFRLDFFQGGAAGMRFTDVIVDADAEEPITLRPLAPVTDFALERILWDDDTFTPLSFEPLYTAPLLAPGDNLNLFCFIPDVLPDLRIRCVNQDGEPEIWYIADSGEDGSLLLLDEVY